MPLTDELLSTAAFLIKSWCPFTVVWDAMPGRYSDGVPSASVLGGSLNILSSRDTV